MKKLIALAVMSFAFTVSASVFAETQQEKMGRCSKEAKGLKGDEFKNARNKCLKEETVAAKIAKKEDAPAAKKEKPQERMSRCSKEAKGLKGDEYKRAKNKCLSNK